MRLPQEDRMAMARNGLLFAPTKRLVIERNYLSLTIHILGEYILICTYIYNILYHMYIYTCHIYIYMHMMTYVVLTCMNHLYFKYII